MSRWSLVALLAIVLSCQGLATIAGHLAGAGQAMQQALADEPASPDHGGDTGVQAPAEGAPDAAELLDRERAAAAAAMPTAAPHAHGPSGLSAPFIEGPRRPPRLQPALG